MLINTLVGLFCTFISKQPIILSVGYKWSNCFPSASSRDQINSDSLASQISTALVKRVKRHDCLTVDIGYIILLRSAPARQVSPALSQMLRGSRVAAKRRMTRMGIGLAQGKDSNSQL